MTKKILNITWLAFLLIGFVLNTIIFVGSFSNLKKSTGNFMAYYVVGTLLLGAFITIRELIRVVKK